MTNYAKQGKMTIDPLENLVDPTELTDEELDLVAGGASATGPMCGTGKCPNNYFCYPGSPPMCGPYG